MSTKEQEIQHILSKMQQYGITLAELGEKIATTTLPQKSTGELATRIFTLLGGLFILSGLGVYTSMFWHDMSSFLRILITLGVGIALSLLSAIAMKENKYPRLIMPLVILAASLETTGWFVMLDELFPHSNNFREAALFVFGVMSVQQSVMFYGFRRTSLLFTILFFVYSFLGEWFSLLDMKDEHLALLLGICLAYNSFFIARTVHHKLAGWGYFIGSAMFYDGLFSITHHTTFELLYPAVAIAMIYVCTLLESTALLVTSSLAIIGFIGYYTSEHFVDSVGWPVALFIIGLAFLCVGAVAVKVKNKYL